MIGAKNYRPPEFVTSIASFAGSTRVLTIPSGVQQGDLMVLFSCSPSGSGASIANSSWQDLTGTARIQVLKRWAGESEPSSYSFAGSAANKKFLLVVYRGATDIDVLGSVSDLSVAPSVTMSGPGLLLGVWTLWVNSATATLPTGMSERVSNISPIPSSILGEEVIGSGGATGDRAVTWSTSADMAARLVAIK